MGWFRARRLERSDLPVRVEWFNTPSVFGQMTVDVPLSLADTEQWFARNALSDRRRDMVFEAIDLGVADGLVAMGGLVDIDLNHHRAELYVVTNPARTRHGFGRLAVHWLCNFGFLRLNLARIYLYHLAGNVAARQLYESCGFTLEGTMRQHIRHNDAFLDRHVLGLLRSEWERLPWRMQRAFQLEVRVDGGVECYHSLASSAPSE